jgi:predicted anti-sigma-YlaC factor YlaD
VTCRELADFLADYLSGSLAAGVRARFDDHLARCRNCRQYLANYSTLLELEREAFERDCDPPPADVPEDLIRAIIAARGA